MKVENHYSEIIRVMYNIIIFNAQLQTKCVTTYANKTRVLFKLVIKKTIKKF